MPVCCHPIRRIFAYCYDILVNIALWMVVSLIAVLLNHGQAIGSNFYPWYQIGLMTLSLLFYTMFWSFYGQTIGMRAWGLQIVDQHGQRISYWRALRRFILGLVCVLLCGLPILLALLNDRYWSLMEYGSGSYIVRTN